MMKKNLLLILMCFVCGLVYAHDGLNFRNLDVKSGISDNYVRYGLSCATGMASCGLPRSTV